MGKGKLECQNSTCRYAPKITSFKDFKVITNGVDCSALMDVEEGCDPVACPLCGSETKFVPYNVDSITVAKYSAKSKEEQRQDLLKRRENFTKSKEGRYMRERAEYAQGVAPRKT